MLDDLTRDSLSGNNIYIFFSFINFFKFSFINSVHGFEISISIFISIYIQQWHAGWLFSIAYIKIGSHADNFNDDDTVYDAYNHLCTLKDISESLIIITLDISLNYNL